MSVVYNITFHDAEGPFGREQWMGVPRMGDEVMIAHCRGDRKRSAEAPDGTPRFLYQVIRVVWGEFKRPPPLLPDGTTYQYISVVVQPVPSNSDDAPQCTE